ncbi:MAG: hypothetical protein C4519_21475 [Desulfobacteraceae bacterium]|nr:MAG: hypothetical protein C4519_21475 [Desulfobacteraceae bacterium]
MQRSANHGAASGEPPALPLRTTKKCEKLFVCYVPGLDRRRVTPASAPFVSELLASYPAVDIATLPSTELLPTMVSGVYPHEHGIWQLKLRSAAVARRRKAVDHVPDFLATTAQCVRKLVDSSYDLAAMPARRRRRFDLYRFKYERRMRSRDFIANIGPYASIFGLLGEQAQYLFTKDFDFLATILNRLPSGGPQLEFLEMYALDLFQHWNLDRPAAMLTAYQATDRFIQSVHRKCQQLGITFMLLVDHGQERVVGTVPLLTELLRSGVSDRDFTCFVEVAQARFWCHTEAARVRITEVLKNLSNTTMLGYRDLHQYHVAFEDDGCGELYLFANPGYIFFPHDFYQPLANVFLALSDRHQRSRLFRPWHRGCHGYLPIHPSEKGYAVLADHEYAVGRPMIELIDIAPSLLALLGTPPPDYMKGTAAFH